MFIDRIFSVSGFGTVVTGSVLGGNVKKDDHLYLLHPAKELRVRRIERHGEELEEITAGNRVSINLVGLNREDFKRGIELFKKKHPLAFNTYSHLKNGIVIEVEPKFITFWKYIDDKPFREYLHIKKSKAEREYYDISQ